MTDLQGPSLLQSARIKVRNAKKSFFKDAQDREVTCILDAGKTKEEIRPAFLRIAQPMSSHNSSRISHGRCQ